MSNEPIPQCASLPPPPTLPPSAVILYRKTRGPDGSSPASSPPLSESGVETPEAVEAEEASEAHAASGAPQAASSADTEAAANALAVALESAASSIQEQSTNPSISRREVRDKCSTRGVRDQGSRDQSSRYQRRDQSSNANMKMSVEGDRTSAQGARRGRRAMRGGAAAQWSSPVSSSADLAQAQRNSRLALSSPQPLTLEGRGGVPEVIPLDCGSSNLRCQVPIPADVRIAKWLMSSPDPLMDGHYPLDPDVNVVEYQEASHRGTYPAMLSESSHLPDNASRRQRASGERVGAPRIGLGEKRGPNLSDRERLESTSAALAAERRRSHNVEAGSFSKLGSFTPMAQLPSCGSNLEQQYQNLASGEAESKSNVRSGATAGDPWLSMHARDLQTRDNPGSSQKQELVNHAQRQYALNTQEGTQHLQGQREPHRSRRHSIDTPNVPQGQQLITQHSRRRRGLPRSELPKLLSWTSSDTELLSQIVAGRALEDLGRH